MVSYKELGLVNTNEMFKKAFEGGYSTATGGAIIGVEMDLNNPQDKTPTVGLTVGGGVYTGGTIVIEIRDGTGKK